MVARYASSSGCNLAARAWEFKNKLKAQGDESWWHQLSGLCLIKDINGLTPLLILLQGQDCLSICRNILSHWNSEWQLQVVPKGSNVTFCLQKLEPRHCLQTGGLVEVKSKGQITSTTHYIQLADPIEILRFQLDFIWEKVWMANCSWHQFQPDFLDGLVPKVIFFHNSFRPPSLPASPKRAWQTSSYTDRRKRNCHALLVIVMDSCLLQKCTAPCQK